MTRKKKKNPKKSKQKKNYCPWWNRTRILPMRHVNIPSGLTSITKYINNLNALLMFSSHDFRFILT